MKLIGSKASPFTRRIRIHLEDVPYELQFVDVFSEEGKALVYDLSPTGRVPLLQVEDRVIWDSLLILRTLLAQKDQYLSLDVEKELLLINEATDAGVVLYQIKKFGVDTEWASTFASLQLTRLVAVLDYFNGLGEKDLLSWNIQGQWLYCLLDWLSREIYPWWEHRHLLSEFMAKNAQQKWVLATDPRL
jgi:glutathione S-transferase